jgi:hypothetical protein
VKQKCLVSKKTTQPISNVSGSHEILERALHMDAQNRVTIRPCGDWILFLFSKVRWTPFMGDCLLSLQATSLTFVRSPAAMLGSPRKMGLQEKSPKKVLANSIPSFDLYKALTYGLSRDVRFIQVVGLCILMGLVIW